MEIDFQFAHSWFENAARATWDVLMPQLNPTRILEVGSHDGASTCYLIEKLGSLSR